ncbi:hypothetical protein ANCCAN_19567 [Ancylostoma caninum]|uniref:Uncharacterized protein n=1 Tax=Ancylostoma caninum TaxID=29170 RepID=A0A368FR86_ANCCA|nr:hypothetical protein ANCCAN_19567 [Ancylostoma caninum]
MAYMSRTWLPPNGQFTGLRNHPRNHGARTTNFVEGSHTRIRRAFGARTPTLREMIRYCKTEITIAKSLIPSYFDGSLNPRYVRPAGSPSESTARDGEFSRSYCRIQRSTDIASM